MSINKVQKENIMEKLHNIFRFLFVYSFLLFCATVGRLPGPVNQQHPVMNSACQSQQNLIAF